MPGRYARRSTASRCRKTQRHRRHSVMLSSVVGRAIEPTCSAVVHKAQTAVAAISGQRCARWHAFSQRRVRGARLRPNFFNHM